MACAARARGRRALMLCLGICLSLLPAVNAAHAEAPGIAVIYPQISEPYRDVFRQIVDGVREAADGPVIARAIEEGDSLDWIGEQNITRVIALGRRGMAASQQLPPAVAVVVGAVLLPPGPSAGVSGVTLTPHPARLFDRLLRLSPSSRRVYVVYHPENNEALMALARDMADQRNIELIALAAADQREAMLHYREIVERRVRPGDAIWLPQDSVTVNESVVLPLLLEKAWAHQIVVFSSSPAHVRRGVLFALYPDNVAMGRRLAGLVHERAREDGNQARLSPLVDLRAAINVRAADHLRLGVHRQDLRDYDLVFPSR